jgi:hypothetical protein
MSTSYERFMRDISSYDKEIQEKLILEYTKVYDNMVKRREYYLANFIPGPVLQRCPANCYFDGPFTVYWSEEEIVLEHFTTDYFDKY